MWTWLSDNPIAGAFAGFGMGVVAMLYWLGATFTPDEETEARVNLDDTQPLPMMPSFDNEDDAIAWHDAQAKRYKEIKREKLDQAKLMELLEDSLLQIEELSKKLEDLGSKNDEDETIGSVGVNGVDAGVGVASGSAGSNA